MNTEGFQLVKGGITTIDDENVCVFHGIVNPTARYWVYRFKDGPAKGDHGPYPMGPPEQFEVTRNHLGMWVMTPCDPKLACVDQSVFRYERVSMSSLSNEEAGVRKLVRGAIYRRMG